MIAKPRYLIEKIILIILKLMTSSHNPKSSVAHTSTSQYNTICVCIGKMTKYNRFSIYVGINCVRFGKWARIYQYTEEELGSKDLRI